MGILMTGLSIFPPHSVGLPSEFVAVGIGYGDDVEIELASRSLVSFVEEIFQCINTKGWGNPFSSMNAALQKDGRLLD